MQGVLLGAYLILQSVSWAYGKHLMEEWNLARWRSRASLRFFDTLPSKGLDLLGGNYQLLAPQVKRLECLGMLVPPVARDLRISKLGRDCGMLYTGRGEFQRLYWLPDGRWHAWGYAICNDERPPGYRSSLYQGYGWRVDGARSSHAENAPDVPSQKRANGLLVPRCSKMLENMPLAEWGTWQADLPSDTFGNQTSGTVAAWAYDYERTRLYHIPGDHELSPQLAEPVKIPF